MNKIIDLLRLLKSNYSTDMIYFERLIEGEVGKPVEIHVENETIKMYHKITGSDKGIYTPSENFKELAYCFIKINKPCLKVFQVEEIKTTLAKFKINKNFKELSL